MLEPRVGGLGPTDVEPLQRRNTGEEFQRGIGNLGPAEIQPLQVLPVLDDGRAFVADLLGEVEVELFNRRSVLQRAQAAIGDAGEREVEAAQIAHLRQPRNIGIGDPARAEIDILGAESTPTQDQARIE